MTYKYFLYKFLLEQIIQKNKIKIVKMDKSHISSVSEIHKEGDLDWDEKYILGEIKDSHSNCYVIMNDKKLIGSLIYWTVVDESHIIKIAIKKEYRGMGFGRIAMNFLLEQFRNKNITTVYLEVSPDNSPAINLYKSFGFKIIYTIYANQSFQRDMFKMELSMNKQKDMKSLVSIANKHWKTLNSDDRFLGEIFDLYVRNVYSKDVKSEELMKIIIGLLEVIKNK